MKEALTGMAICLLAAAGAVTALVRRCGGVECYMHSSYDEQIYFMLVFASVARLFGVLFFFLSVLGERKK